MKNKKLPRKITLEVYDERYCIDATGYRDKKHFWVEDKYGNTFNTIRTEEELALELGDIANTLKEKYSNLRQVAVYYSGIEHSRVFYCDGYFGRPLIPVQNVGFKPLTKPQIKRLKENVTKLKSEGRIPNLLVA